MPPRELDIGATVHFNRAAGSDARPTADTQVYRVEQLLKLPGGAVLYTIKSEAEPFERVVAASDLDRTL